MTTTTTMHVQAAKALFYVIMHKVYEDGKVKKKRRLLKRIALPKRDFAPSKNVVELPISSYK